MTTRFANSPLVTQLPSIFYCKPCRNSPSLPALVRMIKIYTQSTCFNYTLTLSVSFALFCPPITHLHFLLQIMQKLSLTACTGTHGGALGTDSSTGQVLHPLTQCLVCAVIRYKELFTESRDRDTSTPSSDSVSGLCCNKVQQLYTEIGTQVLHPLTQCLVCAVTRYNNHIQR